jgi:para-aminobenzoate synthetase component 1
MLSRQTIDELKEKAALWVSQFEVGMVLDSNYSTHALELSIHELIVASGTKYALQSTENSFEELKRFANEHDKEWILGFLTYDLKNQTEELQSQHPDGIGFPGLCFFVPEYILVIDNKGNCIAGEELIQQILTQKLSHLDENQSVLLQQRVSQLSYLKDVEAIRQHIINGDVYELNYCVEFFSEQTEIKPVAVYNKLHKRSAVPFGCFVKQQDRYVMGASPERFLTKQGKQLISQPIKGTAKRGATAEEDNLLKKELLESEKERAENLMIVDLVRNDLARSSETGSIQVDELFGIYSFPQVHQMISTVSSTKKDEVHSIDAIKHAFPMGSMTGAPKIMAMKLIEEYEKTKRGLYSGAIGYFSPDGNFDFNVVIRSIQYNAQNRYLNFEVGSAITYDSVPEQEYEECLLKAKAMMEVLGGK